VIEIDTIFAAYHRRKHNYTWYMAFFFTKDRSDEILEVGAIDVIPLLELCMN
jgi:hypothetical protein